MSVSAAREIPVMNAYALGQTLLVAPQVAFERIAQTLQDLGWTRADPGLNSPPLVSGEPEWAMWTWQGQKPVVVYTFNPVAQLRVLDVATLPPLLRGAIAERLPLIDSHALAAFLVAESPRDRLLGLWGALETERIDLVSPVLGLRADPEPIVAEQARAVATKLDGIIQARIQVLASLRLLAEAARALIADLSDPLKARALCPGAEDCARLFDAEIAEAVAAAAQRVFAEAPSVGPGERYPALEVTAAPAGLLRSPNELSDKFPRGYRDIAGWMQPDRIWLTWAFKSAAGGAVRYDGLAWMDDHWVWLPKPFRIVAPLVLKPSTTGTARVD